MKRFLYLALALLFMATLISFTASSAKAKNAATTWGALKDGGDVKAAPLKNIAKRDGFVHTGVPTKGAPLSQDMQETLTEIGMLLDRNILAEPEQAVNVEFQDLNGNPINQINKGNPVRVYASHGGVNPFKGTCILVLPVNNPIYKEIMLHRREAQFGVGAEWYYFYIPNWSQIGGTAIGIVIVDTIGTGSATLTVF